MEDVLRTPSPDNAEDTSRKKRQEPDDGHSPHDVKRQDQDQGMLVGSDALTEVSQNSSSKKWSYKLTTTHPNGFVSPQSVLRALVQKGTSVSFTSVKVTESRKIILLRVKDEHEPRIFNSLLKHVPEVAQELSMGLTVEYFKARTERPDPTACHAILRNVPNFVTEKEVHDELEWNYGDGSVEKVMRVVSRTTRLPTSMIRIMCTSKETAEDIISNGLQICGLMIRGEKAFSTPKIVRCYRCQDIGHIQHACNKPFKCGKCAESHHTRECPVHDPNLWKCGNCNGTHAMWYHGCPANVEHTKTTRNIASNEQTPIEIDAPTMAESSDGLGQNTRTYSAAVKSSATQQIPRCKEIEQVKDEFNKLIKGMEQKFISKIETLTEEVEHLKNENSKLREDLESLEDIHHQTKRNESHLYGINERTCVINDKLTQTKEQIEENHNALVMDIQWMTAYLCNVTNEKTLKTVHQKRLKDSSLGAHFKAMKRDSVEGGGKATVTGTPWTAAKPNQKTTTKT